MSSVYYRWVLKDKVANILHLHTLASDRVQLDEKLESLDKVRRECVEVVRVEIREVKKRKAVKRGKS
jgi:hypothetical protein